MDISRNILSEITTYMKYAKYDPTLKRRENWKEIIDRNKNMHLEKFPSLKEEIESAYRFVYDKKILPSMRSLQFSGKPIVINNTRLYNCCFLPIDDVSAFSEVMFLLLSGVGVGYSVQNAHIEKLPSIVRPTKTKRYLVGDSIEGWADAVKILMKAYFTGKALPVFDYSDVRQKGALLITAGGKAPGPEPLKDCVHNIQKILDRKQNGDQLTSLEVHDICCYIADAVLSGGIRRSAMISLFDIDDDDMLTCKFGNWWENNPQRARANNTAVVVRHLISEEVFFDLWKKIEMSGSGEPGVFFTNDPTWGLNPCLTGDTLVAVADGRGYVSIKQLADEGKDVSVFSIDDTGTIVASQMRRPHLTSKNSEVYKIILDDGNVIRATKNHKFPMQDGTIKTVADLVPGDSFRTLTKYNTKMFGKKRSQDYSFLRFGGKVRAEHRVIAEHHYNVSLLNNTTTLTVHHRDFDAQNNFPENLEVMTVEDHNMLHRDRMLGENNPIHRVNSDPSRRAKYISKLSEASFGEKNGNYSGVDNDSLAAHALKLTMSLGRVASTGDWIKYADENGLPKSFSGWRKTHLGEMVGFLRKAAIDCGFKSYVTTDVRVVKSLHYYLSQGYDCFIDEEQNRLLFNKICEVSGEKFVTEYPEVAVKHEYAHSHASKMAWKIHRSSIMTKIEESHKIRKSDVRERQAKVYNDIKFSLSRDPMKDEWRKACEEDGISPEISRKSSPFRSYNDLKNYAATSNHKVVSIEFDGYEDVYNGTVDENHNFFIGRFEVDGNIVSINTMNCAEISLRPFQFCNLCTINVGDLESQEDLNERARAAAFIGTLQASYTNFHYLREIWKRTTEKEALIGISMTGIASGAVLSLNMKEASTLITKENARVADIIGIKPAARTTTVKPEGTSSLVLGTSSGIHAWHNDYYTRRIRVGKDEAIYKYLNQNHSELVEDDFFKPKQQAVISVPQKAPENATTRKETALDLLRRVEVVYSKWITPGHRKGVNKNNVSTTITVKPDEWKDVGEWMWKNKEKFTALSVLPYNDHTYVQAPFEDCTKEDYEKRLELLSNIDLTKVIEETDNTTLIEQAACVGGGCEI